uniref:BCL2 associated X, apoptosis regulator b n=1 Tax=Astatotilapia calliptera TaxID=8154 RepID=A0A3P8PD35_ASTCA
MACAVNGMSDERIGEALIKEVIEEELKDVPSEDVPPLTPLAVEGKTEQEEKLVKQLSKMIRIVGDRVQHDQEFQDVIDGVASGSGSKSENFRRVADKVFEDGITWERIAVLIYVAGRLAVKMVEAHLPQSVREVLTWAVNFFKNNLLGWILEHGGWWVVALRDPVDASMKIWSCQLMFVCIYSGLQKYSAPLNFPTFCHITATNMNHFYWNST